MAKFDVTLCMPAPRWVAVLLTIKEWLKSSADKLVLYIPPPLVAVLEVTLRWCKTGADPAMKMPPPAPPELLPFVTVNPANSVFMDSPGLKKTTVPS